MSRGDGGGGRGFDREQISAFAAVEEEPGRRRRDRTARGFRAEQRTACADRHRQSLLGDDPGLVEEGGVDLDALLVDEIDAVFDDPGELTGTGPAGEVDLERRWRWRVFFERDQRGFVGGVVGAPTVELARFGARHPPAEVESGAAEGCVAGAGAGQFVGPAAPIELVRFGVASDRVGEGRAGHVLDPAQLVFAVATGRAGGEVDVDADAAGIDRALAGERIGSDVVGAGTAVDRVGAEVSLEHVAVARTAGEVIVAHPADHVVAVARTAVEGVVAQPRVEVVLARPAVQTVVAPFAEDGVSPGAGQHEVAAVATDHFVAAPSPVDPVAAGPAFDRVIPAASTDPVVAAPTENVIVTRASDDHVRMGGAVDLAVADDRGAPAEAPSPVHPCPGARGGGRWRGHPGAG
jgi:hypothetical protein